MEWQCNKYRKHAQSGVFYVFMKRGCAKYMKCALGARFTCLAGGTRVVTRQIHKTHLEWACFMCLREGSLAEWVL